MFQPYIIIPPSRNFRSGMESWNSRAVTISGRPVNFKMHIVDHCPEQAKKDCTFYFIFHCDWKLEPGNLLFSLLLVKKAFVDVLDLSVKEK